MWTFGFNHRRDFIDTILIVEGKPALSIEITSALTKADFKVARASDYFEALWRLNDFKPDLVIMNVELPLLDGWEACNWLHQNFGIPIILLGKETSDKSWVKAVEAGADYYLRVPLSFLELTAIVKAILRRYKKS